MTYQVWRCSWCSGVRFHPENYPTPESEIHQCSVTEGAAMVLIGTIEVTPLP